MSATRRRIRRLMILAVVGSLGALGVFQMLRERNPEEVKSFSVVATANTMTPVPSPAISATTTTTVPEIEALIPLTMEAMTTDVARSVGFVLTEQGTGSGVVISEDLLVTNAHVVWPDPTVTIVFPNGAVHQGRVLALDPFVDLALVDISRLGRRPPPLPQASVEKLEIGDDLFAIGYPSPDDLTPLVTVDVGEILGFTDWEFTGMRWFTIEAPAIGGQSGGAVVDEFGRLVGISTFGSTTTLTSISIDDVVDEVDRLLATDTVRGIEPRIIPHSGARRSNRVQLSGPWDQQLLFGWFLADAEITVEWAGGAGSIEATTVGGREIVAAEGSAVFTPGLAFPVVVQAEGENMIEDELLSSLPLIAYEDADHGRVLPTDGRLSGIYEVGGDRDYFYLPLAPGDDVSLTVESAARTRLVIYGPAGEEIVGEVDASGFIGSNAAVEFTAVESGRHVVAIESSLSNVSGYTIVTRRNS